jgi:UDP-N-acetylglucosamine--N-acetylmuramyl-(pentapeptide) pyrophosphoryl-undecaprenol N-acetylglucosamine transferase
LRDTDERILVAGGGTGGHVYPGVAIARELQRRRAGREILFVGTAAGLETRLVPAEGYRLEAIRASGLVGMGLMARLRGLARLPLGLMDSWRILGSFRPHLVVGVGGYASGPALAAALIRRLPTMIHEQNRWPGVTNRMLARLVDRIAVSFPGTSGALGRRGVVTGNPVRPGFAAAEAVERPADRPARVLVFGGSRGARALNEAMMGAVTVLAQGPERVFLHHQTGPADLERVQAAYRQAGYEESLVEPYIDRMPEALAAADLVVCRAGASTLAELAVVGRASVLVPLPQAAHDHQRHNARGFVEAGAARMVEQSALDGDRLAGVISNLAGDRPELTAMSEAARKLARPEAAARIADLAEELLERRARA